MKNSPRILAVDDDPRSLRLLEACLVSRNYDVVTARSGEEAVASLATEQVSLVLMDVMMQGMDGYEACRRIREFSNLPVIMVTAKGDRQDRALGFEAGADDYVTKPFYADELAARIAAVIRRTKAPGAAP